LHSWEQITSDPWTLEVVKGYHLEFSHPLFQTSPSHTIAKSPTEKQLLEEEIQSLILKQAVVKTNSRKEQNVSGLKKGQFLPPSSESKTAKVIHFKMEGTGMLRDLLQVSDWMCSIDLKDAYLSVSIYQEHQWYLRFTWRGNTYEFTCLPFRLTNTPRVLPSC